MQFYKSFLDYATPFLAAVRLECILPFCPRDLSISSLSLSLFLLSSFTLPAPAVLTQFCNFNLIFAHRYRTEQTAIMRADFIRLRRLSASAYFFRPLWHFRKNPRVAPHLCKITRKIAKELSQPSSHLSPSFSLVVRVQCFSSNVILLHIARIHIQGRIKWHRPIGLSEGSKCHLTFNFFLFQNI